MSDELTLPGSIPGLLRGGSPVAHPRFGCGIMLDPADPVNPAVFERVGNAVWSAQDLRDAPGLALDLASAPGRAHAAWWLAGKVHSIGTEFKQDSAMSGGKFWMMGGVAFHSLNGIMWRCLDAIRVPALATLDPNDPRLLPDGSRWVDAEALRLVCLHVAGLEVPRG